LGRNALIELEGKEVNGYLLHLGKVKQLRLSSWKGFELSVKNQEGIMSLEPVIKGIFSSGAKDGIGPWLDLAYWEELEFKRNDMLIEKLSLSEKGLDHRLFRIIGDIIPPGGHMMVSYEGENPIHINTVKSLGVRIPAAVTPLGYLLFRSGFHLIKNWYLSEGGFEGPRKLWAEKAPDSAWAETFYKRTAAEIESFLEKERRPELKALEEPALKRAKEIIKIIEMGTG
jgi:hypothetical protein